VVIADQHPTFEDLDHVNRVLGLVMEHYNTCRAYAHGARRPPQSTVLRRHPQSRHL
jgi:hypothetical protein